MKKLLLCWAICLPLFLSAQTNLPEHRDKPYVILISLDGYRYDYTERFQPPNLSRFVAEGVQAEGMIASFPTKTFPNHYTIATGMYPENHGLVDNTFYDPQREQEYRINKREAVEDGSWYGGTPLWVNAEQQGMVAASYFFVGSEADVQGVRPSYYYRYDGSTPNDKRVEQVLAWLAMPEEQRPHLITLYFSDMDDAGHRYGPNNDEKLSEKLIALDVSLGKLFDGVQATGLPVNIIIVSDHGMVEVTPERLLPIESIEDENRYRVANAGALVHLYLRDPADLDAVYQDLRAKEDHFRVYKLADFPYYRSDKSNPRLGDLIVLPDYAFYFTSARRWGMARQRGFVMGEHGFPPEFREMYAIFYANGPAFRDGLTIQPFENIHVYPLICNILGLPIPAGVDGKAEVLAPVLVD